MYAKFFRIYTLAERHYQFVLLSKRSGKESEFDICGLLPTYKPGWAVSTLEGRVI